MDLVPLLGAIVGYHCSVLWLGGTVTTNFNFGGTDVVPLLGAIAGAIVVCYGAIFRATNFTQTPKKTTMNLASCRRYTVLYIDNTQVGFCYLGSMLV